MHLQTMTAHIPSDVSKAFQDKYDWLKREQVPSIGNPDTGIYQNPDGGWQQWFANWASIAVPPGGTEPHEVHGGICARWAQEGGAFDGTTPGWLGYPVSDEEVYEGDGDSHDRISHFENGDIIWTAKSDSTRIVNVKDRVRWYKCKHDQLLKLLREAVEAPAPQRHNEALRLIDEKCREDQFDVVLLGDFQFGKSTLLDTLCGGREMSPQGQGTAPTSAVPVSVQSLAPGEAEEWGEIRFKTKRTLAGEIHDTFESEIGSSSSKHPLKEFLAPGEAPVRARFCDGFDLDNAKHCRAVKVALEDAWKRYREGKCQFATRQRQLMEVTTLIVRFYHEFRDKPDLVRCPIEEIGGYVWFPADWSNASEGFDYAVDVRDVRFAFVDAAILHLRSPFLEKLGCRVTDCPGLDASAYDKEITRRALIRADGVLFVHKCTRTIGASALGNLFEFVKDTGRTGRTCLALNLWGISKRVATQESVDRRGRKTPSIVEDSIHHIRSEQYDFPIIWCHVLLAYLAALGERRLRTGETFTEAERGWLREKADSSNEDEEAAVSKMDDAGLWAFVVRKTNRLFKVAELDEVLFLDEKAVQKVWEASHLETLLDAVAHIVLREKAESILVANGSQKALEILREHEQDLKLLADEVTRDEQECAREVDEAKEHLDAFERESAREFEKSYFAQGKTELLDGLAREFRQEVVSDEFMDRVVSGIAARAYKLNKKFAGFNFDTTGKRQFSIETGREIAQLYANFGLGVLARWREKPDKRWKRCQKYIADVNEEISRVATEHFTGKRLFKALPIPQLPLELSADDLDSFANNSGVFDEIAEKIHDGFWKGLWNVLTWLFGGFWRDLLGMSPTEEEIIREYGPKIRPELEKAFQNSTVQSVLENAVRNPVFGSFYASAIACLHDAQTEYRKKIEGRCHKLLALHQQSKEKKRETMERNRRLSEDIITPLRSRVEVFEKTVATTRE